MGDVVGFVFSLFIAIALLLAVAIPLYYIFKLFFVWLSEDIKMFKRS